MPVLGTVDIVLRLVDQVSRNIDKVQSSLSGLGPTASNTEKAMAGLSGILVGGGVLGAISAFRALGGALGEIAQLGAQLERVSTAFAYGFEASGENATTALNSLRAAARGTVSDLDLMTSANKALSLGVAATSEEIGRLIKVATVLGRRTGLGTETSLERLFIGIGRLSPRILDDLGIAVNLTRLFQQETGKAASELEQFEKIQTLLNFVLKEGDQVLAQYGGNLDDRASSIERAGAAWQNFKAGILSDKFYTDMEKTLNFLAEAQRLGAQNARIEKGTADINDLSEAIDRLTKRRETYLKLGFSSWKPWAPPEQIRKDIEELNALRNTMMLGYGAPPSVNVPTADYEKEGRVAGEQLLELSAKYESIKIAARDAFRGSSVEAQIGAAASLKAWEESARRIALAYNIAQEEIGGTPIDIEKFVSTGELVAVAGSFDVLTESTKRVAEATEAAEQAQRDFEERLKRSESAVLKLSSALQGNLSEEVLNFKVAQVPGDEGAANAFAASVEAAFGKAVYQIVTATDMIGDQEAQIVAITRAYEEAQTKIDDYVTAQQQIKEARGLREVGLIADLLVPKFQALTTAQYEFNNAQNDDDKVAAANAFAGLRSEVEALAIEYNRVAELAGLDLIDIDALQRGEVAVLGAKDAIDFFNRTQAQVPTYAQMVGSALSQEAAAFDVFTSQVAGAKMQLMTQIMGMADIMDSTQMSQLFSQGADIIDSEGKRIAGGLGNAYDKAFQFADMMHDVTGPIDETAAAMRSQASDAENLANTIENKLTSAYNSLNSVVSGELNKSLGELSNIGIKPEDFMPRSDVPAENARRLADIMVNGLKDQSWLEEFKSEVPGIWDELSAAPNMKEAAARMLQEFQLGLRPELIDFTQLKQQIKDKIATQMRMDDLAQQITDELIAEMGAGNAEEIQQYVNDALGVGVKDSKAATETSLALLAQFSSPDFKAQMAKAGESSVESWFTAFLGKAPEYTAQLVEMLATLVTPAVQAQLNTQQAATAPR